MRPWLWAFILTVVLTSTVAYQLANWASWPSQSPVVADEANPQPLDQKSDRLPPNTAEAQLQQSNAPAVVLKSDELPAAGEQAPPEDVPSTGTIELATPSETKQNLSWLAYYAYSEYPPETKPAETVLDALKGIPPGTPIEEIKRVADILGLNVTFMKAVAKIESGFNPNQRTGSYIGLFQLSENEFQKYGAGNIRDPRDNTVAAALKIMTEAILFETFTHKNPTLNDLYLIHQQGVDGAAEHVSHPNRLAWQSMCATFEGQEKGEKWCKRAIWGNTLPAIKRAWKSVDKVTSAAFVAMWQQRVSYF
ncbi:MAG TPA: transglycosylase SLT domain-containing protein, partial [Acetobacteraceae bacterium]|nr:transglycosylase SLT domain-containing protein [Acetobacteraceae bacterium]